jgi:hypothetical protein
LTLPEDAAGSAALHSAALRVTPTVIRNFSPSLLVESAMPTKDLLPGVRPDECPPRVVVASRREVSRARLRATLRDVAQIFLLLGIDYFFTQWPTTHIPSLSRAHTLLVVVALNVGVITHVVLSRLIPKLKARRIAATWCLAERARFFAEQRGEQAHN